MAWQIEGVHPRRLLIFPLILIVGMFSACQTTPKPLEPSPATVEAITPHVGAQKTLAVSIPTPTQTTPPPPSPKLETASADEKPAARTSPQPPATPSPVPQKPSPTTLDAYVTRGRPESGTTPLTFVPEDAPSPVSPSLFEDAIILSRLRAALKAAGASNTASESARVQAGDIYLSSLPAEDLRASAGIVDAALGVPGVRRVIVDQP